MQVYDTVTAALADLRRRGFVQDFNLVFDELHGGDKKLKPQDFEVLETYRFEGETDPADGAIVYAIADKDGHKGVLVHGYGTYSEDIAEDMIRKLRMERKA